ncbi:MAG: adenylate kinase [archaeon]
MKIILLGAPSAGKGTYISRLKKIYPLPHISTGDLFRENIKNSTEIGIKAKSFIDAGKLVPDEIVIDMLKDKLSNENSSKGFFLDGFPRTAEQANVLDKLIKIDLVLNFDVNHQVIIDRVAGRIICNDCGEIFHKTKIIPKQEGICDICQGKLYQREDDKEDKIKKRLQIYHDQTAPLIEYYEKQGILKKVDGNIDIRDPQCKIIENCCKILDEINSN